MTESCKLIREAIREGWPTERGPEILAALVDGDEVMSGADIGRAGMLLLKIDKQLHG